MQYSMDNKTKNYDQVLPILPLIINTDILSSDFSLTFGTMASSSSLIWNTTDPFLSSQDHIILYRHPLLYGAAIYALLLIIVGTMGNILTIIILLRPNLRKYTTMRYLTAVAVADLCSLYSWNLNLFYKHLINPYQNDIEDGSIFSCRLISFIAFVSLQLSSWYLTLVSLDRCLNIHFLFWNRQFGKAKYSVYIILSIAIIILSLNTHLLFLNGYKQESCIPYGKRTCYVCYARLHDQYYIFPKWEKIHVIIYNFIPFSVMLISNCFIIHRLISSTNTKRISSNSRKISLHSQSRQRRQRQMTCILVSVTFLFVFLTTPVMIYHVFLRSYLTNRKPLKYIILGILLCAQFTSHAINIFVYCYGASKFRRELKDFFSFFLRKKQQLINRTTNSSGISLRSL